MENRKRSISIKNVMISVFMVAMIISISSIGYLVFSNWVSSARNTTERIAKEMNQNISTQIYSYLHVPEQINESNHKIISNDIVDLSNENQRDKFFCGVLSSYEDEIYSFSYGTAGGEYYGARRNETGAIEIMRNNASTGGNSWYYSVDENFTIGKLAVQAGKFDPRTRAWYQAAIAKRSPTFSPVYKHFVMNDLTISYACPIYNRNGKLRGVLGTHMILKDIGTYLEETVRKYNGYAVILEKDSNTLIANSMGVKNFDVHSDDSLERYTISKIKNEDIRNAYAQYKKNFVPNFLYEGSESNLILNVQEIKTEGLKWVVISAIPEDYLIAPVVQSIQLAVILSFISLLMSFIIYILITRKLLKPMKSLLQTSDAISSGDFTKRIEINRYDEIGKISESFNKVADKLHLFLNNLEDIVKERTDELNKVNSTLEENKNQLRLILDSAAEAIYGIDMNGNCTFCNLSCLKMLGYNNQEDLIGKNMHWKIHHTRQDGTPIPAEDCSIFKAFVLSQGAHVDDEVFWRSDGSYFNVEYYSYPQVKNGEVIGAVVTFMDISYRKQKEAEIQYLSCHDTLTGLHNRRCFEEHRGKIDSQDNLPLSIIFADINGLKMTNDIFGHAAGDKLIQRSSEILKKACRENDVIARVGGDEFIMLLPKTSGINAKKILERIKTQFTDAHIEAIKCSISLGMDTKKSLDQSLDEVLANAENAMYKDKTMNRKSINKDIIDTLIGTLHARNGREQEHSIVVSELCGEIGNAMDLPENEITKLRRAGYLHDIGKIIIDKNVLSKSSLTADEMEKMQQHSVVGYRILNLFDDTLDLAEYVYGHHERWDGSGYPRGLHGEQIPLISRIISVAESYDRIMNSFQLPLKEKKLKAIESIKEGAGRQFDPNIVEIFAKFVV